MSETKSKYKRTIGFGDDEWKPKGARIKWKQCKNDYRDSHCGNWTIETILWECEGFRDFICTQDGSDWKREASTLKEAKRLCEEKLRRDECDGDKEKAHAQMIADGYEPDDSALMAAARNWKIPKDKDGDE